LEFAQGQESFTIETQSLAFKAEKMARLRELTAKKITLDERLDGRIDKALKRLAQLKTFKQTRGLLKLEQSVSVMWNSECCGKQ
jgi:hypothetical protein